MSNQVEVRVVRGIFMKKVDVCDADEKTKYPVSAFGTGEYGIEGCVVGVHKTCALIQVITPEMLDTANDDAIVEQATAISGDKLFTKADIGVYIVRSLS